MKPKILVSVVATDPVSGKEIRADAEVDTSEFLKDGRIGSVAIRSCLIQVEQSRRLIPVSGTPD